MSRWFRHYAGMMRDDKLVRVAIRSKQTIERVVWVWGAILESAAEIDDEGRYEVDAPEIAYFLRADEADVVAIVTGLEAIGRIHGSIVVKWGDRQFSSDRSSERQKRYRDKKRAEDAASDHSDMGNAEVTSLSRHGDAPETETELETEGSVAKATSPKRVRAKFVLPADIPSDPWDAFERMRKAIGKRMTDDARHLAVARLRKFRDEDGWPPGDVLNHCTLNSYQGIFPPKGSSNGQPASNVTSLRGARSNPLSDIYRTILDEEARQSAAEGGDGARIALPPTGSG